MTSRTYRQPLATGHSPDPRPSGRSPGEMVPGPKRCPFQRLRRMPAKLEPTLPPDLPVAPPFQRFPTTLGVCSLARRSVLAEPRKQPICQTPKELLYAAALLHDPRTGLPSAHSVRRIWGCAMSNVSAAVTEDPALRTRCRL